jgi:hypothetical protein
VVEGPVELVHRARPERVAHLRPVERDPDRALVDRPVIGDVLEVETFDDLPRVRVEQLGNHMRHSFSARTIQSPVRAMRVIGVD